MSVRVGYLFPGQGAQFVGMGRELATRYGVAKAIMAMADEIMGMSLTRLMWEGPEDQLRQTRYTQPAILAHSLAALAVLNEEMPDLVPAVAAGHSLGEYGALVAAGVLQPQDALRLVKRRGELMQEAGASHPGAMAAVVGLPGDQVDALVGEARGPDVLVVANLNSPEQVVISGHEPAVRRATELAAARGARVIPLAVSGAFHSPLMGEVAQALAPMVEQVTFAPPRCPVIPNATGVPTTEVAELKRCLLIQIASPVRWVQTMEAMKTLSVSSFVELGPGKVLAGLARKVDPAFRVVSFGEPSAVSKVAEIAAERSAP